MTRFCRHRGAFFVGLALILFFFESVAHGDPVSRQCVSLLGDEAMEVTRRLTLRGFSEDSVGTACQIVGKWMPEGATQKDKVEKVESTTVLVAFGFNYEIEKRYVMNSHDLTDFLFQYHGRLRTAGVVLTVLGVPLFLIGGGLFINAHMEVEYYESQEEEDSDGGLSLDFHRAGRGLFGTISIFGGIITAVGLSLAIGNRSSKWSRPDAGFFKSGTREEIQYWHKNGKMPESKPLSHGIFLSPAFGKASAGLALTITF